MRIEWVRARLEAWARWVSAGGNCVSAGVLLDPNRVPQTGDVRRGMGLWSPEEEGDAVETDRAIASLPEELKRTVKEVYLGDGGNVDIARKLRCSVATLYNRLGSADRRIAEWLETRAETAKRLREAIDKGAVATGEFLQLRRK